MNRYPNQETAKRTATDEDNNSTVGRGEEHMSILAPDFPDMSVAQLKACVTFTATIDGDQVYQAVTALPLLPIQGISSIGLYISERLVAPRLQFVQIRRLKYQKRGYVIVGQ
jgi:hypothetical protein